MIRQKTLNGLTISKYTKKVFYKGLWSEETIRARGIVTNEAGEVVQRPFNKIFNYGIEPQAPKFDPKEMVVVSDKVNGFMLAVSWYEGDFLVSTTGSLEGSFVEMGRELVNSLPTKIKVAIENTPEYTHMFEAVHLNDPHIIKEVPGLYYIGSREKAVDGPVENLFWEGPSIGNFFPMTTFAMTFQDVVNMAKTATHEGYVVYSVDGLKATKIKSPFYLGMKFLARVGSVEKLLLHGKNRLDEEFYGIYDEVTKDPERFIALEEQDRLNELLHVYWTSKLG